MGLDTWCKVPANGQFWNTGKSNLGLDTWGRSLKTGKPGIRGNITWARAHLEHQENTVHFQQRSAQKEHWSYFKSCFCYRHKTKPTTDLERHPKNMDFENISQRRYNSPTDKNTSRTRKTSTTKCRGGGGEALYNTTPAMSKAHIWQPIGCWRSGGARPGLNSVSNPHPGASRGMPAM